MAPIAVLSAPLEVDLSPLTQHLWAEKIAHRVVEEGDQQILLIVNPADAERIKELLTLWENQQLGNPVSAPEGGLSLGARLAQVPLTVSLILTILAVFIWQHTSSDWHSWLTQSQSSWPEARNQIATYLNMSLWEVWRPVLLHFDVMHILFNALWIWVFAGAMERQNERVPVVVLLFACGLTGNLLQWWLAGPAYGGISGVVYGLAAWTWLRQKRHHIPYGITPALFGVMVFFMALTMFGDILIPGLTVAGHGGHLGGLLCGLFLALIWPVSSRRIHES